MMATLLSLAGYLLYLVFMMALFVLVMFALFAAFPSLQAVDGELQLALFGSIYRIIAITLKNILWFLLISESRYTLPSSVSQVIARLLPYLSSTLIGVVVVYTCYSVCAAALGRPRQQFPDWMVPIIWALTLVVMDMVVSCYDMIMATVLCVPWYLVCMVLVSCVVLAIAAAAIDNTRTWWPELVHTSIVALALLLLNRMWGSPFEKPTSTDDDHNIKTALVGYLIYIVSSMALSCSLFGLLLLVRTFVISLTFVLLDMSLSLSLKPSSSAWDAVPAIVGLAGMIATTLMALFFVVALSFVVFMFLHTWLEMLLPSAWRAYPAWTFVCLIGLTFTGTKTVLGLPVERPSFFLEVKAEFLGIAYMINGDHGAYKVIVNLIVLPLLLSMNSGRIVSRYQLYAKAAFIVTLGLLFTMTEKPSFTLVSDELVQERITSFVTSQIEGMDGEIKQLTNS